MIIEIPLNNHTIIELEEITLSPGCHAIGMNGPWEYSSPAEGPEYDYINAWIVRGDKRRRVDPRKIVDALDRRDGEWRAKA